MAPLQTQPRSGAKPQAYTAHSFIGQAEAFGIAAFVVADREDVLFASPSAVLALHCAELSLKAFLLHRGASAEDLKRHGHSLRQLLKATSLDWSDLDPVAITFYHDVLRTNYARYRDKTADMVFPAHHVCEFAERIFHKCLGEVMPGAWRPRLRRS